MFFLLGPSGCGKTTVLRMLAGFLQPDGGDILFEQKRMNDIAPQDRNTAMVFQNYAIWPHMTVYENVAYGPRARKMTDVDEARDRCAARGAAGGIGATKTGAAFRRPAAAGRAGPRAGGANPI